MQITLLSFLFKTFNIIKKGININNTLKLYAVLFSCFIFAKGQRPSGFKAIIKSIFKTNLPSLTSAPFFSRFFRPFFLRKLLKFTKSCKNASKNEIYLQVIYQSSNHRISTIQKRHLNGQTVRRFFLAAMFLASALRRGTHPPRSLYFKMAACWRSRKSI